MDDAFPSAVPDVVTCDSCGRAPARPITVRRHVGLLILQQFVTARVVACRSCGHALIRSYTARTLWQGWWGAISFFFNWFVLLSNALAWRTLGRIGAPSLSGELLSEPPRGFILPEDAPRSRRRSRARLALLGVLGAFILLGVVGWGLEAARHDHDDAHGSPAPVAALEREMTDGPFTMDDGRLVTVVSARCSGEGETLRGGYTHFTCELGFAGGEVESVTVHILEDALLFKSFLASG